LVRTEADQLKLHLEPLTRLDVMTTAEVAELIRIPTSTVYELARRGVLPGHRVGRAWRFVRAEVEEWLLAS
jgi:excisionase family DNA binding protein